MSDRGTGTGVKVVESPRLLDFKGDMLLATAGAPLPPGSRVDVPLCLVNQGRNLSIRGKVVALAPDGTGGFRISIRCHTLTREERHALLNESKAKDL